ncbi:MAG: adenine methyltransferase, partial [Candidatus Aminicenantes bacterium]|nr:adenine methyltransferase [Candidatus Aminicenantes bacterium]NIN44972.1 adenine methyltransferase [Candidatus Aminicenantes bacterium]NIN87786.1 adenine methyltransferase [Candidatus Aminicenantes bacterium]NIQ70045.1 adenine methyltransferase [Candidatus Aminicenantes bacterium]NIR08619.1 adenine methyltransferase [Candidatus Aminicenantes bacterium]
MGFNKNLFKSERLNWKTPKAVYQTLDAEFNFDFDPCPPNPKFNGLVCEWGQCNFVNPPYGREIKAWVNKGIEEHKKGKTVVFLVA